MASDKTFSRRELLRRAAVGAAGVGLTTGAAEAQTPRPTGSPAGRRPLPGAPGAATPPAPAADITDKNIDDVVKGFEKIDGVITLYRKKNDLYAELKPEQLGQTMLLQATRATGAAGLGGTVGDPLGDTLFAFQKQNDQIYVVEPNLGFRASAGTPEAVSIKRSFADAYLAGYRIEAIRPDPAKKDALALIKDPAKKADALDKAAIGYLIHIPSLFLGDLPGFTQGLPGYQIDAQLTFVKTVKNFLDNLVVTTQYNFAGRPAPGFAPQRGGNSLADNRSIPEQVVYNLFPLKDNGYKPRFYDDRIGYFTEDYQNFDDDTSPDDKRRLIMRWNLQKKDMKAALSEPIKPITFWVDNATPVRYRKAIQEGVEAWNVAFEPLGFKNAVVCKIMPDNADWDPSDMRHNVVRWMSSPGLGYAVAQFRHNPLTGEIINSGITVDYSWARFTHLSYPLTVINGQSADGMTPREMADALVNPKPVELTARNQVTCQLGPGLLQAGAFAWQSVEMLEGADAGLLPGETKPSLEEYTNRQLHQVVMHEMGHCLGLRHNFKGSMMLTPAQLQDKEMTTKYGIMGSVMDYGGPNLAPVGGHQADYFMASPGPYDRWAIAYGYTDFGGSLVTEAAALPLIAARSREFGHDFASDENADNIDPTITRYDLSGDPLGYRIALVEKARKMLGLVEYKYPQPGQPYYELTRAFRSVLGQYNSNSLAVARFVGGIVTERNHYGEKDAVLPVQAVPSAEQRRALATLCKYVFAGDALRFAPSLLAKLQQNPLPGVDNTPQDLSVLDTIANVQAAGLFAVLNPALLSRVETNEFRSSAATKPLTVLETMRTVTATVWSEVATVKPAVPGKTPTIAAIPPLRRRLQRTYVDSMIGLAKNGGDGGLTTDAVSFAQATLRELVPKLMVAEKSVTDPITAAHLTETRVRINRFLHAQAVA